MALRSRCPAFPNLTQEQFRYLEGLDRRIPARADLTGSESAAEIAEFINALLEDLRAARIMERSS
jgi:hypothetical protein